jgi:hypothetical protein
VSSDVLICRARAISMIAQPSLAHLLDVAHVRGRRLDARAARRDWCSSWHGVGLQPFR